MTVWSNPSLEALDRVRLDDGHLCVLLGTDIVHYLHTIEGGKVQQEMCVVERYDYSAVAWKFVKILMAS